MKPTQNNNPRGENSRGQPDRSRQQRAVQHRDPSSGQARDTVQRQGSLRNTTGAQRPVRPQSPGRYGVRPNTMHGDRSKAQPVIGRNQAGTRENGAAGGRTTPARRTNQSRPPQIRGQRKKMNLARATLSVLGESAEGFRIKLSITSQDVARAVICGVLIIIMAMLQTTVFVRFPLFGAVPDLMLALTVALAFSEGERFGAVCGLISAFVIESVGGVGMTLLPLLYVPAGFFCGVFAKNYLSDSVPSRAALISICSLGRMIITLICASVLLNATLVEIIWKIAIPEYFSTLVMSAVIYALVWITMKNFHKTRAEKTEAFRP